MLAVKCDQDIARAKRLAKELDLPLVSDLAVIPTVLIGWESDKLALFPDRSGPVFVDFLNGRLAHRRLYGGGRKQPLARAIGLAKDRIPSVIDATAGLGRDSFVLASLGCKVQMIERSLVIAALLQDAIDRANCDQKIASIMQRMSLVCSDSCQALNNLPSTDVIYLDPMYPEKRKTAAVKKDMRALQQLLGPDHDSAQLLQSALQAAKNRVVVKRPVHASPLQGPHPDASISSPNTRYDIYAIRAF